MPETWDSDDWLVLLKRAVYGVVAAWCTAESVDFVPPELETGERTLWCRPKLIEDAGVPARSSERWSHPLVQVDLFKQEPTGVGAVTRDWITDDKRAESLRAVLHQVTINLLDSTSTLVGYLRLDEANLTYLGVEEGSHHWMVEVTGKVQV